MIKAACQAFPARGTYHLGREIHLTQSGRQVYPYKSISCPLIDPASCDGHSSTRKRQQGGGTDVQLTSEGFFVLVSCVATFRSNSFREHQMDTCSDGANVTSHRKSDATTGLLESVSPTGWFLATRSICFVSSSYSRTTIDIQNGGPHFDFSSLRRDSTATELNNSMFASEFCFRNSCIARHIAGVISLCRRLWNTVTRTDQTLRVRTSVDL